MSAKILYISYDGLMTPLGQSQVLQYLKRLASQHAITLLSYEKPEDITDKPRFTALKSEVKHAGIEWWPLVYHKRPSALATAYDLFIGLLVGSWVVATRRIRLIHARSYVPSVLALVLKKFFGVKYIFDMRGFWADERVDGNIWPVGSYIYQVAKWFERSFFLAADVVVSLTHAGVAEIQRFPYLQNNMPHFEVIPTCTNLELFSPSSETTIVSRPFTLGYVGSVGTWYLLDEMINAFKILLRDKPDSKMLFINRNEHEFIRSRLAFLSVPDDCVEIIKVNHDEVVKQIHHMDAGIFFIKPVFSKKASAPTKLGEFLACGIPCLGNTGVGDVEAVLEIKQVGVAIHAFDEAALTTGVQRLLELTEEPTIQTRCVATARRNFSLEEGVAKYNAIYERLAEKKT